MVSIERVLSTSNEIIANAINKVAFWQLKAKYGHNPLFPTHLRILRIFHHQEYTNDGSDTTRKV
jgi:hypothetical protein